MILDGPTARRSYESRLCPACGGGKCAQTPLCHRCKRRIGGAGMNVLHYAALDHRDSSETYARCLCSALDQLRVSDPVLSDTIEAPEHAGIRVSGVGPASDVGARSGATASLPGRATCSPCSTARAAKRSATA